MNDERRSERRPAWWNERRNAVIPLSAAMAIGSSLLTAAGVYYAHDSKLNDRIAEVREQYVRKEELDKRVEQPLRDIDQRQRSMEREQIRQGEAIEEIRRILNSHPRGRPDPQSRTEGR